MNPRQALEKEETRLYDEQPSAATLGQAANSENTLQGYAAINAVSQDSEIALESLNQQLDRDAVARLAYQYFEERGFEHGSHDEDWYRAEQEIRRRSNAGDDS